MSDGSEIARPRAALVATLLPVVLVAVLGSLWGMTPTFGKLAGRAGIPALGFVFWQSLGAFVLLSALCWRRGRLPPIGGRHVFYYLGTGILGLGAPNTVSFLAVQHIPAGVMSVVITTVPLATYAMSLATGLERADWRRALGIALGFAGCLLIVLPRSGLPAPEMAPWVLFAFLTPACYSVCHVFVVRFRPPGADSLTLAAGMMAGAAGALAVPMLLTGSAHPLTAGASFANALIAAQVLVTAGAFVTYFAVIRLAGPVFSSQASYVVTITGLAWGIGLFGERYSAWVWGAAALVLAGLTLVNLYRSAARPVA